MGIRITLVGLLAKDEPLYKGAFSVLMKTGIEEMLNLLC
jgi:hypothetical protein